MAAAGRAMDLGADHAVGTVLAGLDRAGQGIVEARPAGAALEFQARTEQLLPAAGAGEAAGPLLVQQRAASRPLGAVLAHDMVLLRREPRRPSGVAVGDGKGLGGHGGLRETAPVNVGRRAPPLNACSGPPSGRRPQCLRESSRVAASSPAKVSGYIRSENSSRIIR